MKKFLILFCGTIFRLTAQDIVVLKSGEEVYCRITSVNESHVNYKIRKERFKNTERKNLYSFKKYSVKRSDIGSFKKKVWDKTDTIFDTIVVNQALIVRNTNDTIIGKIDSENSEIVTLTLEKRTRKLKIASSDIKYLKRKWSTIRVLDTMIIHENQMRDVAQVALYDKQVFRIGFSYNYTKIFKHPVPKYIKEPDYTGNGSSINIDLVYFFHKNIGMGVSFNSMKAGSSISNDYYNINQDLSVMAYELLIMPRAGINKAKTVILYGLVGFSKNDYKYSRNGKSFSGGSTFYDGIESSFISIGVGVGMDIMLAKIIALNIENKIYLNEIPRINLGIGLKFNFQKD